jgi:hypothetical protein
VNCKSFSIYFNSTAFCLQLLSAAVASIIVKKIKKQEEGK